MFLIWIIRFFYYLCGMDLFNLSIDDLVELKNRINNMIYEYKDGYVYICNVRSYGSNWTEKPLNSHNLQELCYRYDGQDGIVDVYSTNPNLNIENYGDVKYIESVEDYKNWVGYERLKRLIPEIKEELDQWDNKDNVPFNQRPMFSPIYTRGDLAEYELKLGVYDMSFVPPIQYNN